MGKLRDKRVIVTGGGSGIGKATVLELAKHNVNIGIHYRSSKEQAKELKSELLSKGINAEIFQADLTAENQVGELVEKFVSWVGGIDILINNAGDIISRVPTEEMSEDFFKRVMDVNITATFLMTKYSLPYLKESARINGGASIVNMSSLAGRTGAGQSATAYCTSKGAIITMTKAYAREFGRFGIRVNAVAPGLILGTRFHQLHTPKEMQEKIIEGIPLKKAGTPEDVARAIVFLASEFDGFINGAILDINGGVW